MIRPMEMSSKREVTRKREVVELHANKTRDPRFDGLSGKLNQEFFEKSYDFLDEYTRTEKEEMKRVLRKTKDPKEAERLKRALNRYVRCNGLRWVAQR
jgi:ribosomal RNA-processing protein 36